MWNKNERDGKVDQAKGRVKQAVGTLTGDKKLKAEGQVDETVGRLRPRLAEQAERLATPSRASGML